MPKIEGDPYSSAYKSFRTQMRTVDLNSLNIILITVDTLRADHLECYGYDKVKTPHINRLANDGIFFEHNVVQAPLTLPSHSSILTGTFPLFHGVRDNSGFYLGEDHANHSSHSR
jgi:arylsulfatase A-like enzyme